MIKIIELEKDRYAQATALIWEVFQVFEVPDFPPHGVIEYKRILDKTEKEKDITFYCATLENELLGVLGMRENNHIGYFYVRQEHHKKGIGKMLFNTILEKYSGDITVNACPYGVAVYERLGFVKTDDVQDKNGIIYTPMKYVRGEGK